MSLQLWSHSNSSTLKSLHQGSMGSSPRGHPFGLVQGFFLLHFRPAHPPSPASALWARCLHKPTPCPHHTFPLSLFQNERSHASWGFVCRHLHAGIGLTQVLASKLHLHSQVRVHTLEGLAWDSETYSDSDHTSQLVKTCLSL